MSLFTVAQIGSREHYAVPRALEAAGRLAHFYTDAWAPAGRTLLARGPAPARALAARFRADVPAAKITPFTPSTLWRELTSKKPETTEEAFLRHAAVGRDFCARVNRTLPRHLKPGGVFFGYDTGCLETLPLVRELGGFSIVDQIDPARVEQDIVLEECAKFPGWQAVPGKVPDAYFERLAMEWEAADRVVVNSRWSADALAAQGVPAGKIRVVPLAYEPPAPLPRRIPRRPGAPLRVLFLGQIILRKGVQYLFEAARLLRGENISFTLAGPLGISDHAMASMPGNVRHAGRITRDRLTEAYLSHDVFVLPTLSDGFALTQLEAMAHGLPVIATPCCGEVVTHGVDGLIVQPRDPAGLARALLHPELTASMPEAAQAKAARFTLGNLANLLGSAVPQPAPRAAGTAVPKTA